MEELNLGGRWSEMDIAPTVLDILDMPSNLTQEGSSMPIRESFDLRVAGAPAGVELWRGNVLVADASGDQVYNFRGLPRGLYTLKSGGQSVRVLVNGDQKIDLAGKAVPLSGDMKKLIGIILIMAINLGGLVIIIRIWKKGE